MGIYINFMSLRAADAVSGVALIVDTWVGALLCPTLLHVHICHFVYPVSYILLFRWLRIWVARL